MVYGCGNRLVKFLFFTLNLLICLFGALILGLSLWVYLDHNFAHKIAHELGELGPLPEDDFIILKNNQSVFWLFVTISAALFLLGFFGCCGAMCESNVLLTPFFIIVLIMTIIETSILILIFIDRGQSKVYINNLLTEAGKVDDENLENLKPLEDLLQCCGATSETMNRYIEHGLCEGKLKEAPDCFTVISDELETKRVPIIITVIISLIIGLMGLVLTCKLSKAFRSERPYYYA